LKVILDTSFLIELKKGNEKAVKALEKIKDKCEDILVSSLTVYELLVGANYVWRKYGDAREMMNLQDMLKFLTEVDVSGEVVRRAAKMKAELMVRGKDVPDIDILIACSDDAEILTFDSDFKPLRDLDFKITILGDEDG
jgi:predicted nucleic acid-binding protein